MLRLDPRDPSDFSPSITPDASAAVKRRGRRPRWHRWCWLLLIVVVAASGALMGARSKSAPVTLPDGTRIQLEAVTHGAEQKYPVEHPVRRWFRESLPFLGQFLTAPLQKDLGFGGDSAVFWFTRRTRDGQKIPLEWSHIAQVHDSHGCPMGAAPSYADLHPELMVANARADSYPRRGGRCYLHLTAAHHSEPGFVLPVDIPVIGLPKAWQPSSLPIRRSYGKRRFILDRVKLMRSPMTDHPRLFEQKAVARFRVFQNGHEESGWEMGVDVVADPTGNAFPVRFGWPLDAAEACWFAPPCMNEPVWSLRVRPRRSEFGAFAPEERIPLGALPILEAGRIVRTNRVGRLGKRVAVTVVAVTGPGKLMADGQTGVPLRMLARLPDIPSLTTGVYGISRSRSGSVVESRTPLLVIRVRRLYESEHLTLIIRDRNGVQIPLGLSGTFAGPQLEPIYVSLPALPEQGPLSVEAAIHSSSVMEFRFAPPAPEARPSWDLTPGPPLSEWAKSAERYVALSPRESHLLNNLAWHYATGPKALQRPARALVLAKRAVAAVPEYPSIRNTLGVCQFRVGDLQGARLTLLAAASFWAEGQSGYNLHYLARVEHRLKRKSLAREYFRQAVAWERRKRKSIPAAERTELAALRDATRRELGLR